MKVRAVDYIFYNVSDVKKATDFYKNTLGLTPSTESDSWAEFDIHNVTLAIGNNGEQTKSTTFMSLSVEDINEAKKELEAKGIETSEIMDAPDSCLSMNLTDPDGNPLQLHQRKDGTAG